MSPIELDVQGVFFVETNMGIPVVVATDAASPIPLFMKEIELSTFATTEDVGRRPQVRLGIC